MGIFLVLAVRPKPLVEVKLFRILVKRCPRPIFALCFRQKHRQNSGKKSTVISLHIGKEINN